MKNTYKVNGDETTIFMSNGETVIETKDLGQLLQYDFRWFLNNQGYVATTIRIKRDGKTKNVYIRLHRLIMNAPEGLEVDHINRIRNDNRKSNLRLVTLQENLKNKSVYKSAKSGITGVSWKKGNNKWRAVISIGGGKQKHLGYFDTIEEAEKAVKSASGS